MKLSELTVTHFLGVDAIGPTPIGPVTLFCGNNFTGKTSIQQAIRMLLTGEPARVKLKGDYGKMIADGHDTATLSALWADEAGENRGRTVTISDDIPPDGLVCTDEIDPLRFVLEPHRFAAQKEGRRKSFLFDLMGVSANKDDIAPLLTARGGDTEKIKQLMPLFRGGFEVAEREAEQQAKSARAVWKGITGEGYGSKKAETWEPQKNKQEQALESAAIAIANNHAELSCPECGTALSFDEAGLKVADEATTTAWTNSTAKLAERAQAAHRDVEGWCLLQAALSPTGIPSELLGTTLGPFNSLLASCGPSTWAPVQVDSDLDIAIGGRDYALCSESEQWRADAVLAEAIATRSGLDLIMLDRVDVLDVSSRGELLEWALEMAENGLQSILFATLKKPFAADGLTTVWLEDE